MNGLIGGDPRERSHLSQPHGCTRAQADRATDRVLLIRITDIGQQRVSTVSSTTTLNLGTGELTKVLMQPGSMSFWVNGGKGVKLRGRLRERFSTVICHGQQDISLSIE